MTDQKEYYELAMGRRVIDIKRISREDGRVFGVLSIAGVPVCVTLEPLEFSIPERAYSLPYLCERVDSPTFGETFEIFVRDRSHILFHWGNRIRDSKGCILLGSSFGVLDNEPAILNSKDAHKLFMSRMAGVNAAFLSITSV